MQILNIVDLKVTALEKMGVLDLKNGLPRFSLRISFMSSTFDYDSCPTIHSEEIEVVLDK